MRTIANHTRLIGIAAIIIAAACSDTVGPNGSTTIAADHQILPSDGAGPAIAPARVVIYSGLDADTALRAEAQRQLRAGNGTLAHFADTSVGWRLSRFRLTSALATGTQLPGMSGDIEGEGEPGEFNLEMLQKPVIYYHNTFVAINSHSAVATTTQSFSNATDGKSDMTYDVTGPNGAEIAETTSPFWGVGGILNQCVDDILHRRGTANCNVQGTVQGYVNITLAVGCGETISASAIHNAWAAVPFPDVTRSEKGWSAKFGLVHGGDAFPGLDGKTSISNSKCEPPQTQTRRVATDGGDMGGFQIIMEERQINTTCYAIQDRTVQGDGYVGPWVTIGVECYSSVASKTPQSAGTPDAPVRTGVAFTLAGISDDDASPLIIRRGTSHAALEQDAIVINLQTATANDIAGAVTQLQALAKRDRLAGDAQYPLRRAAGALDSRLLSSYATLLSNLKSGREDTVPGVGNAKTIPVIVIP